MLEVVSIPTAELGRIKSTHLHVLQAILAFADKEGRCWPGLRKLAEVCGMTLSRVQRAISEMVSLGYVSVTRQPRAPQAYQISARFISWVHGRNAQKQDSQNREVSCRDQQFGSPAGDTKGEAKKDSDSKTTRELEREDAPSGAWAHSQADKEAIDELCLRAKAHLGGTTVEIVKAREAAAENRRIANAEAYAREISRSRFQGWLANMAAWVNRTFTGEQKWTIEAGINEALTAGSRQAMPRHLRQSMDKLNKLYRADLAERMPRWRQCRENVRAASIRRARTMSGDIGSSLATS